MGAYRVASFCALENRIRQPDSLKCRRSRLDFLLLVENLDAVDRPALPVRAFCRDR
jgi:hypothetical protein